MIGRPPTYDDLDVPAIRVGLNAELALRKYEGWHHAISVGIGFSGGIVEYEHFQVYGTFPPDEDDEPDAPPDVTDVVAID